MLIKQIFHLYIRNYEKCTLVPKLKYIGRFCQVQAYTDHGKPLSNKSIRALTQLVQSCKQETRMSQMSNQDILKDVCVSINLQVNDFGICESIRILDLLSELNVSSSSNTISYLLDRINTLSKTADLKDYNRIMLVLGRMSPTPSIQAMKKSLNKKFVYRISTRFDKKNFYFLVEALKYACFYARDSKILTIIIDALKNHNFEIQSPSSIVSLMETLSSLKYFPLGWNEILKQAQNAFIINIDQIANEDIAVILKKCSLQVKENGIGNFYNITLYDKAIKKLISSDCISKEGLFCLESLNMIRHTSKELLNYFLGQIYTQKEILKKSIFDEHKTLFAILEGCAYLKYKPILWEMLLKMLRNKDILNHNDETLIIVAIHLLSLDHYEPSIIKQIFENDINFKNRRFLHYMFLKIYQKLKIMPDYPGPFPSEFQIESFQCLIYDKFEYPLYADLKEWIGGPQYIKTNIRTKLYHQIDHIIAFQPGGKPLAINEIKAGKNYKCSTGPIENLEDLNIPENCQIIAIMSAPRAWFARNTNQILGPYGIYFETLEALSCRVAVVPNKEWDSLPKHSRIPYLVDIIKFKLDDMKS